MKAVTRRRSRLVLVSVAILAITACSGLDHGGDEVHDEDLVTGITWEWLDTVTPDQRVEAPEPDRYTLTLKPNGEAQIRYDCNHGGSLYEISGNKLSFGPLTATRIPCPPGSRGVMYMRQLDLVVSYYTRDGHLYLEMPPPAGTMRFRPSTGS